MVCPHFFKNKHIIIGKLEDARADKGTARGE